MATETETKPGADHRRSVTVTAVATLGGVAAGVVSHAVASGPTDTVGLAVLVAAILVGMGVMRLLGVDVGDFSTKDNLYIAFETFALWFITWGILLSGA
jgi:hypothetical protein